jgi:hypothetical protein
MCEFNKKKFWLHKYKGSSSVHKQLISVDCDFGLFIDVTGSVLVRACVRVCVCIYCGRCIKSAFAEEGNIKGL